MQLALVPILLAFGATQDRVALAGNDPIEAIAGKTVKGQSTLTVKHGLFTYHFKDHVNLAKFKTQPSQYAFQWGGACGSMGPLTGRGNGEFFSVHEDKLWTFASASCKAKFDKAPAAHAKPVSYLKAPADAPPSELAEKLHASAIAAHHAKGIKGGKWEYKTTYEGYGDYFDSNLVREEYVSFATGKRGSQYEHRSGNGGFYREPGIKDVAIDQVEADELEAKLRATPLGVLISKATPFNAKSPISYAEIPGAHSQYRIGPALVFLDSSGKIVAVESPERTGGRPEKVIRLYSNFRSVDGVLLPHTSSTWTGGDPSKPVTVDSISVFR